MNHPGCNCANRLGDPCKLHEGVQCDCCGSAYCMETKPCQGHDRCTARICENCQDSQQCQMCDLWACSEHLTVDMETRERICDICRADMDETRTQSPDGLDDNRPLEVIG